MYFSYYDFKRIDQLLNYYTTQPSDLTIILKHDLLSFKLLILLK